MLVGSVCIASKTNAKKSTLQAMAPIPAFMAGSMLWLRRRNGVAVVIEHRIAIRDRSTKYEGVVGKLLSGQPLCVHHELERLNPLTYRGGNARIGGRGRPYSETSRDQSGGNGKQLGLAHRVLPSISPTATRGSSSRLMRSSMPGYGLRPM